MGLQDRDYYHVKSDTLNGRQPLSVDKPKPKPKSKPLPSFDFKSFSDSDIPPENQSNSAFSLKSAIWTIVGLAVVSFIFRQFF